MTRPSRLRKPSEFELEHERETLRERRDRRSPKTRARGRPSLTVCILGRYAPRIADGQPFINFLSSDQVRVLATSAFVSQARRAVATA
jgi:hypothetical protein